MYASSLCLIALASALLLDRCSGASWTFDEFKNANGSRFYIAGPTVVALGPDLRYYVGAKGRVDALSVNDDYVVESTCTSNNIAWDRTVLGITFDPKHFREDSIVFFIGTSVLNFAGGRTAIPDATSWAWANGRVDIMKTNVNGECLSQIGTLVSGLSVSNHDHGVNGMTIGNNGRLYVINGGMTNAGHSEQGDGDGGYPATPLSGALLEVNFNKEDFEGRVLYTIPDGRETRILNEPDVKIYASGFMNAFSVLVHSNRSMYMVDNGPNPGYGKQSLSCVAHSDVQPYFPDKFLKVKKNAWYGHPNRNRGRFLNETRQCRFVSAGTPSSFHTGFHEQELTTIPSSTNGLTEYSANVLGEGFKGSVCLARIGFGGGDNGNSYVIHLNDSYTRESITNVEGMETGGLDMKMDRFGNLVVTEYIQNYIKVIKPVPDVSFVQDPVALISVHPNRGPPRGRNKVWITTKFPTGAQSSDINVLFGGTRCRRITKVNDNTISCIAPRGIAMERVHVKVIVYGMASREIGNGDYTYMRRATNRGFPTWLTNMTLESTVSW